MDDLADCGACEGMPGEIHISDVIEVIETDPDFNPNPSSSRSNMFNGSENVRRQRPKCIIVEQPAPKALRFRYECEGRSAGSIPGANSTPENKTYPRIQITGYQGRAVVVVSCVTKDPPYRPHPHNLVGRDGCKRGVCTLEVPVDTMTMTFSNLGIQCVKKKDIESALKTREDIRVDPFRTGFSHRNQPTSIDLNAVRLCFQVFLQGETRDKYTDLTPVVSNPIYDKKAMSDLVIVKLSDCVSPVDGGNKDIILLCEKVAKEDIQVRFYEEKDGNVIWEGLGEFQPSQVHKQTAIWFRPPKYRTMDVREPVKVNIQLKRPSDGATSVPLPFQLLPLDAGRPAYWSLRRSFAKKRNYDIFSDILALYSQLLSKRPAKTTIDLTVNQSPPPPVLKSTADNTVSVETQTNNYAEVKKTNAIKPNEVSASKGSDDKVINELVDQVVELDEIYAQNKKLLQSLNEVDDIHKQTNIFDDTKSYTSLQLAFKNPVDITDEDKYEDIVNPTSPLISVIPNKPDEDEIEKLPPLPPKRAKKVADTPPNLRRKPYSTDIDNVSTPNLNDSNLTNNLNSSQTIILTPEQADNLLQNSNQNMTAVGVARSHSFKLERPKSHNDLSPPGKELPPTPCSTLPKPKKRKFFSGLFSYLSKSSNNTSRNSIPSARNSFSSSKSLQPVSNTLNRSSSNISTKSATSIHIPLKGTPPGSTDDLNQNRIENVSPNRNSNILIDNYDFNLDLTEAEHYALYTAIAPHATQSEFDEASCYYAPVEGGKILGESDLQMRLRNSVKRRGDRIDNDQNIKRIFRDIQEQERQRLQPFPPQMNIPFDGNIKDEPNEPSRSPYGVHLEHLSPSQQFPILTPTPPLAYNTNPFLDPQNPVRVQLPPFDSWNTPSTSFAAQQLQNNLQDVAGAVPPISIPENVMLFNLDSQQTELRQLTLMSDDLGNLTQNLSDNLSLTDILRPDGSTNMTDSVDRLVNCEFDKHCK